MSLMKNKLAVSSIVAALIIILLIGTLTAALLFVFYAQQSMGPTSVETSERISEKAREALMVVGQPEISGNTVKFTIKNKGDIAVTVSQAVIRLADGSLQTVNLTSSLTLIPLQEESLTVTVPTSSWQGLGLLSDRGNIFPIVVGQPTQQPFDFSVSVSPSSGSVQQGGSTSATVSVTLVSGSPQTVTLSSSGLPSGASASFSPSSDNPTFTSTMTISTSSSTPAGTYTITISGTGGGLTRTATYTLTVTQQPPETVTFSANGLGADASGNVLTVDGVGYAYSQLPVSFSWTVGSSHNFEWSTPIPISGIGSGSKRYVWVSTSGLSTSRSGSITVPSGGGSVTATYKTEYQLIISVYPSGAGTTNPAPDKYWHDSGSTVTVSASPNTGYIFDHWDLDGANAGSSNPISIIMNAPHSLTALFSGATYTLYVSIYTREPDGSLTLRYDAKVKVDGTTYTTSSGSAVVSVSYGSHTIEAVSPYTSPSGDTYVFSQWGDGSTSNPRTIVVTSDVSYYAIMQYQHPSTATVTFSASGLSSDASGTVLTVDGAGYTYSQLSISFTWAVGSSHTFAWTDPVSTTTSGKCYVWVSASGLSTAKSGSITVPSGGGSVTATYKTQYQLTISVSPSGTGTTNPAPGTYWYDSGTTVSVSATANTGYTFNYWSLDGSTYTSNPISVTMNAPHTLTAYFSGATYTLTVYVYRSGTSTGIQGVTVKVDSASYTTGSSGNVSISVSYGSHSVEVVSPYSPSSGTRYVFTQWSDGSTSNPRTISVTASTSMTAYMKLQYYLTMQVNPSGAGSVSPSSGWYDAGSTVTISATPASGYVFSSWSGSGTGSYTGTNNPATITMNGPITETANFVQFDFSISANPSTLSICLGAAKTSTITVKLISGSTQTVSLSVSSSSGGLTLSLDPSSGNPTFTSTLTITTSLTPLGTYTVTVSGTVDGVTRSTTLTVYVNNFAVSVWPQSGSVAQGGSITTTVTVSSASSSGSSMQVTLSASGLPSGATASFNPSTVTVAPGSSATSTLTITTSSSTPTGTYAITITGSSDCGGSKTRNYDLTVTGVTVTFYAKYKYHGSWSPSWGSGNILNVDGNKYTEDQVGRGISFTWPVGSTHYIYWYDNYHDESSYISGSDARYSWSYSSGVFTSQSGYLTVPSGGGTVTAYYNRYVWVTVRGIYPSGASSGSVTPGTGWYLEETSFTAPSPNGGYTLKHWSVNLGASFVDGGGTYIARDPCILQAIYYLRIRIYFYDREGNTASSSADALWDAASYYYPSGHVSATGSTVDLWVAPVGGNGLFLYVSDHISGYGGKSLPFWKWSDGTTSFSRTIYVYQPTSYTAYYKCVLWFWKVSARCGAPPYANFDVDGVVFVTTVNGEYGKNGITVKVVWHVGNGITEWTYEGTDTTHYGGYYTEKNGFFAIYLRYWVFYTWAWAEVFTIADGYVNAYWHN